MALFIPSLPKENLFARMRECPVFASDGGVCENIEYEGRLGEIARRS